MGIACDSFGNLFIADYSNDVVREVNVSTGVITTVAGGGGISLRAGSVQATSAGLGNVLGIAVDAGGNLFILSGDGVDELQYGSGLLTNIIGVVGRGYSGDGGPASAAMLANPNGIALDAYGDLFIADSDNHVIREIRATFGTDVFVSDPDLQAPTNLQMVPACSEIDLSWSENDPLVASYTLQGSTDGQNWSTICATSSTSYPVTGLTPSTLYYFRVNAVDAAGTTSWACFGSVQTASSPGTITVSVSGSGDGTDGCFSGEVSASAADSSNFIASIDFGDGSSPQSFSFSNGYAIFTYSYADPGSYTITAAVGDDVGGYGGATTSYSWSSSQSDCLKEFGAVAFAAASRSSVTVQINSGRSSFSDGAATVGDSSWWNTLSTECALSIATLAPPATGEPCSQPVPQASNPRVGFPDASGSFGCECAGNPAKDALVVDYIFSLASDPLDPITGLQLPLIVA